MSNSSHSISGCDHQHPVWLPEKSLLTITGALIALGMLLQGLETVPQWCSFIAYGISIFFAAFLVVPKAWSKLKLFQLDINVLVVVAVIGAVCIGELLEAAMVLFLFALSEWLESWSEQRAQRAIGSLLSLAPENARLILDSGQIEEVAVERLQVGQRVQIRSGDRIAVDAIVLEGQSLVNQASITGESLPIEKGIGSEVYAGTINGNGVLVVQVDQIAENSLINRISKMVKEAQAQKAPLQRFVDQFARIYTPIVFVIACGVASMPLWLNQADWSTWIYRSLVFLMIACPCALVIATPITIVSALTRLSRQGVLMKGGQHLEVFGQLRALALDKTGTLTRGEPQLIKVFAWQNENEQSVLQKAASLDQYSTHPLARCIVEAAASRSISLQTVEAYQSHSGRGAEGRIEGHAYFVGNHRMAHELGVCDEVVEQRLAEIESQGLSLTIVGHIPHAECTGKILGILALGDPLRKGITEILQSIRDQGVVEMVLLSGDNSRTVRAVSQDLGLDLVEGDLLPEGKVEVIRQLLQRHQYVGMIGDGVNDAPALAVASVGIAMGAMGSDTAIETADVALMDDDLSKVAFTLELSRRARSIIRFNIIFALFVKAIFLILACFGYTKLWIAVLADTGATLIVIVNGMRLLSMKCRSLNSTTESRDN